MADVEQARGARRAAGAWVGALAITLVALSCDRSPSPAPSAPDRAPASSPRAALEQLLAAEQRGDHEGSFRLLTVDSAGLDVDQWALRRRGLPPITGYVVETEARQGPDRVEVVAVVEHPPGLDPFMGLTPGKERQTWTAERFGGRWLLRPDPVVEPILPTEDWARQVAGAWAEAVQACDQGRARVLEGAQPLFGTLRGAPGLCGATGPVALGPLGRLPAGPPSQELVAQFGEEVLNWARTVPVTAPARPFSVVLAPIGDTWKVIGVID